MDRAFEEDMITRKLCREYSNSYEPWPNRKKTEEDLQPLITNDIRPTWEEEKFRAKQLSTEAAIELRYQTYVKRLKAAHSKAKQTLDLGKTFMFTMPGTTEGHQDLVD